MTMVCTRRPASPQRAARTAGIALIAAPPRRRRWPTDRPPSRPPGGRSGRPGPGCGDQDQGLPGRVQVRQQVADLLAGRGVQRPGRLVGQQSAGWLTRAPGDGHPLAFPAGQPGRIGVAAGPMRRAVSSSSVRASALAGRIPASWAGNSTLSSTVMSSSRLKNWKIIPIWRRRNRASPVSLSASTRSPPTVTVPLFGRSRPAIRFEQGRLAAAGGPITATDSPRATSRLTWPRPASRRHSSCSRR